MTFSSTMASAPADSDPVGADAALRSLIERGYRFVHPRDAGGEVVAVVGVRAHHTVIDVVRLNAEDDVTAIRMPADEEDILAPATVLWRSAGELGTVLGELLALADDAHPAPRAEARSGGCWVPERSGRARWLAASV